MRAAWVAMWLAACGDSTGSTRSPETSDSGAVPGDTDVRDTDPGDTDAADTDAADTDAADTDTPDPPAAPFNGCTNPDGEKQPGTLDAPRTVAPGPYTDADDTRRAPAAEIDRYDCAPDTRESGAEVWYRLELSEPRAVRIEVVDGSDVDVDVHLLRDPTVVDGEARGCVDRDDTTLERTLDAGVWYIAVDTYASASGTEYPGAFTLGVASWVDDDWNEVAVAPGATWRHRQTGGAKPQRQDVLLLEPALWSLEPARHDGCEQVGDIASRTGARFGINAAYFDTSCAPRTFLRVDGETLYRPELGDGQRAALWNDGVTPVLRWLPDGGDAPDVQHGIGAYPSLRTDGASLVEPLGTADFTVGRHPRTGFGVLGDGRVAWVVVDGRSSTASGLSLPAFADLLGEVGVVDGTNLDGGGSSTLFMAGCSVTGVVNFPSDGGGGDHGGARAVADGVYAWER
jgi:hypothetical protein